MARIDDAVRSEFQHSSSQDLEARHLWEDVLKRLDRRQHMRRIRRRLLSLGLVFILFAAMAIGIILARTSAGVPSHPALAIDPKAGPGGFSVTPSRALLNDQHVTISIHGLHPHSSIWITMCVGKPTNVAQGTNQCNEPASVARLDSGGAARVDFTVERYLTPGGFRVDCSNYPSGCSIAVFDPLTLTAGRFIGNTEKVSFEPLPAAPSNPLHISVLPNPPYEDGQEAAVSGSGFPANSSIRVGECPSNTDCGEYFQNVLTSSRGDFFAEVTLHRAYTVEQGTASGGETPVQIDCSQPLRCFLVAEESAQPYAAASSIPLVFVSGVSDTG